MIINADVKQLEVCLAAQESKDKLLCDLLNQGVDIHRFIGSFIYAQPEEDISEDDRTAVKIGSFGILYGNGAGTLSMNTGRSLDWCKQFIEEFYNIFPGIKQWHRDILQTVYQTGRLKLWDGVQLCFKQYASKFDWQLRKGVLESYMPTEVKNWPIQHLSYVIVSIILHDFYREKAVHKRDKYLIINTVHDSIMLDCKPEFVEEAKKDLLEIVDKLPARVLELFKVKLLVPIKIDVTTAMNWYEVK